MMTLMVIISLIGVFTPETAGVWEPDEKMNTANVAWMITATIFVLMMTPGLSFFYGGMVGKKNVISTILQSFIAMGIISVIWVVFGFSLAFGDDIGGFVGNPATFFMFNNVGAKVNEFLAPTIPLALYALFQMKFAIITPSLITGSFAERVRFSGYMVFMILFCIAALAGAIFLGNRREQTHTPANIPYVILGASMLWLGWFGFNAGSSLAADGVAIKAFLNTNTAYRHAGMDILRLSPRT